MTEAEIEAVRLLMLRKFNQSFELKARTLLETIQVTDKLTLSFTIEYSDEDVFNARKVNFKI